jgi:hypothetical protein
MFTSAVLYYARAVGGFLQVCVRRLALCGLLEVVKICLLPCMHQGQKNGKYEMKWESPAKSWGVRRHCAARPAINFRYKNRHGTAIAFGSKFEQSMTA